MWIQQVFVACLCVLLGLQQITAVVNNGHKTTELPSANATTNGGININNNTDSSTSSSNISGVTDSVAESSEQKTNRREAPLGLSDSYGAPILGNSYGLPLQDSYVPSLPSNLGLPVPVYGVPDAPTNNLVYPALPADIPPPIQNLPNIYGPPKNTYGAPAISLPPPKYRPPAIFSRPQKPHNLPTFNIPKPVHGSPSFGYPPRPQYGPPSKQIYIPPKLPKPTYGTPIKLPKPHYGVPKPLYVSPNPLSTYGPPTGYINLNLPKETYGPPINIQPQPQGSYGTPPIPQYGPPPAAQYGPPPAAQYGAPPAAQYGPPQPIPHGPPHPGAPAPPTPPDIKYDGWKPIFGLVSRPPSGQYGVPKGHGANNLQFNTDFISPPSGGHGSHGGSFKVSSGPSDSYGAPLNTVTGSGGIISSSGDDHRGTGGISLGFTTSSFGIGASGGHGGFGGSGSYGGHGGHGGSRGHGGHGGHGSSGGHGGHGSGSHGGHGGASGHGGFGGSGEHGGLSVIKSIGYEIVPNAGAGIQSFGDVGLLADSYVSPPLNSFSPEGPYAAAHSYNSNGFGTLSLDNFASSLASSFDTTLLSTSSNGFGQDFSSGIGLIPPSGVYGVPPSGKYGTPLFKPSGQFNGPNLNINPPKHPVVFREPVPAGLIESIGNSVAQKDAHGIIDSVHSNNFAEPSYVPPPVPDATKPVKEEPSGPSTLYSLPNKGPTSFQNYVQGSSIAGLNNDFGGSFNFNGASAAALTSYTAPLATVDGSYGHPNTGGLAVGLTTPQVASEHNNFGSHNYAASNNFETVVSGNQGTQYFASYQGGGHDCSQKSQPLPSLSFGVPAANSYTASLASLNTNIAGAYQGQSPSLNYAVSDLQTAHSQSSGSVSGNSNSLEKENQQAEVTGKSFAQNFGSGSELVKSQSVDLNNIPLQGALGSYTLQIQSADGSGSGTAIPHNQVLNDGLLQSILNAIEQPQQNTAAILGQPLLHLQQIPPQTQSFDQSATIQQIIPSGLGQVYGSAPDSEAQNSVTKNIVVTPPPLPEEKGDSGKGVIEQPGSDGEDIPLIGNNEIALYFNNNAESLNTSGGNDNKSQQSKAVEGSNVRNGQQYGSYVSFKTPNSSYVYGNVVPANATLQGNGKSVQVKT